MRQVAPSNLRGFHARLSHVHTSIIQIPLTRKSSQGIICGIYGEKLLTRNLEDEGSQAEDTGEASAGEGSNLAGTGGGEGGGLGGGGADGTDGGGLDGGRGSSGAVGVAGAWKTVSILLLLFGAY